MQAWAVGTGEGGVRGDASHLASVDGVAQLHVVELIAAEQVPLPRVSIVLAGEDGEGHLDIAAR